MKIRTIIKIFSIAGLLSFQTALIYSQHEHHRSEHDKPDSTKQADTTKPDLQNHDSHDMNKKDNGTMNGEIPMPHSFSLSLPMNRNGSGTGWLPDASPMNGYMLHSGKWMFMFHGSVFLRYTSTDITKSGIRGSSKWDAPNWIMGMAQSKIGSSGLLRFGLMMSLDRATEGGEGYPLLYQSGETWNGRPLVDRQHPHDLFSELSMGYNSTSQ